MKTTLELEPVEYINCIRTAFSIKQPSSGFLTKIDPPNAPKHSEKFHSHLCLYSATELFNSTRTSSKVDLTY